jgi:predicted XRE-type DNA-binding protein
MKKLEYEEFANVWDAIEDTPEEAAKPYFAFRSDGSD